MLDNIFNYTKYLERRKMIGCLHSSLDQEKPIIGLLVPVDTALNECVHWSGQDITRPEFLRYLNDHDVYVFNTLDDFVKERERDQQRKPRKTKRLFEIIDELNVSKERIEFSDTFKKYLITGKSGWVSEDESSPLSIHVYVFGRSKRHWSSIKRKLSFMKLTKDDGKGGYFIFDRTPDEEQATALRNMIGMSKCHKLTNEHKQALRDHAAAIRENKGASLLQLA